MSVKLEQVTVKQRYSRQTPLLLWETNVGLLVSAAVDSPLDVHVHCKCGRELMGSQAEVFCSSCDEPTLYSPDDFAAVHYAEAITPEALSKLVEHYCNPLESVLVAQALLALMATYSAKAQASLVENFALDAYDDPRYRVAPAVEAKLQKLANLKLS